MLLQHETCLFACQDMAFHILIRGSLHTETLHYEIKQACFRTYRTTKINHKVFLKNSSLITKRHNPLCDSMLQCDELPAKLITPEGRRARCDELVRKLITPQHSVSQYFTWQCDEWWVSKENFFAYSPPCPFLNMVDFKEPFSRLKSTPAIPKKRSSELWLNITTAPNLPD